MDELESVPRHVYHRNYCKARYHSDPAFRQAKLERNRKRYQRKTTDCPNCGSRITSKNLETEGGCLSCAKAAAKRQAVRSKVMEEVSDASSE